MERTDEQLAEMLRREVSEVVEEARQATNYRALDACRNRLSGMSTVLCWSYGQESESYRIVNEGVSQIPANPQQSEK